MHSPVPETSPTPEALRTRPEDQWFERKSFAIKKVDLARAMVGMANSEGGTIVLGIQDRQIQGLPTPGQDNAIRQAALDLTEPTVRVHRIDVEAQTIFGDPALLILLNIEPGTHVHRTGGQCYLRVGDSTVHLKNPDDILELQYTKGDQVFDSTKVSGTSVEGDLAPNKLAAYAKTIGSASPLDAAKARHLVRPDGCVTPAALLMFGRSPQSRFPNAMVRVLKWLDVERAPGRRQQLEADERFEGTIPDQLEKARGCITDLLPSVNRLGSAGRFVTESLVPPDAWLEGLVNAVIHRSYSMIGDHVRFEIFPDRIEITSPGRFPGLADPRDPEKISRFARNPVIARIASELRIGQELGEGIRRIFSEMRSVGFTDPRYRQTSGSVTLVLATEKRVSPSIAATLPGRATEILDALRRADRPLGTGEVSELSGFSRPFVRKALTALRDSGLVEWHGKSPRDPRATWTVTSAI